MIDYAQIVELCEVARGDNRDAATIAIFELNSAGVSVLPIAAQQLLDIGKLCEEYSDDRWDAGYRIVANAVQAILDRQAQPAK